MKKHIAAILLLFFLASCAAPTPSNLPKPTDTPLVIPTRMPFPTRMSDVAFAATSTAVPDLLDNIKFVSDFSNVKNDWQVVPGNVTPQQINDAVAKQEGEHVDRVNQKVLNGFLRSTVTQVGGQVFEVLVPAEAVNGKLRPLTVKNVGQTPVLSSHAVLLEDYYAINFPDVVDKWEAQGAVYEDFKYAAVVTITWATKFGPLRVSYKLSGKYISEEGKYPGRVEFLKLCMYESTKPHYNATGKLTLNYFPAAIVGLSGAAKDGPGVMKSDAFGWTPMVDFATAEQENLAAIAQAVHGVAIESKETLAQIQSVFDRAFLPVHCSEVVIE